MCTWTHAAVWLISAEWFCMPLHHLWLPGIAIKARRCHGLRVNDRYVRRSTVRMRSPHRVARNDGSTAPDWPAPECPMTHESSACYLTLPVAVRWPTAKCTTPVSGNRSAVFNRGQWCQRVSPVDGWGLYFVFSCLLVYVPPTKTVITNSSLSRYWFITAAEQQRQRL